MIIKQQKGSFLLEFLIALGIFSIAIVGLVKLQNRAISDLGDLGTDMAIPILIDDFTARINLSQNNKLEDKSFGELEVTANAMMKDIKVTDQTITIVNKGDNLENVTAAQKYTVVIDYSGRDH